MTTAAEIAELDIEELDTRLVEGRKELFNLRFQLATGQLDNFSRISQVKKDVARLLTELRAREIAEAEGLALEEMPGHLAAARQRTEDDALGRTRTPAAERRAARRAADAAASGDESDEEEAEEAELLAEDEVEAEVDEAVLEAGADDGDDGQDDDDDVEEEG
jgi:large subunit ribosomal protein L29